MRQSTLFGLCLLGALGGVHAGDLVVHEWGTITSIHQATGSPVSGLNKIDAADVLPDFVHRFEPEATRQDPKRRVGKSPFVPGRPDVTMRLETPVIYFYPPVGESTPPLDLSVDFRGGVLNEFYPDAAASVSLDGRRIDDKLRAGMFSAWDGHRLNDFVLGTLEWKGLRLSEEIAPPATTSAVWLAPRNVRATGVVTPRGESERYVFYRGVAHLDALFQTQYTTSGLRLTTPARPLWAGQPPLEVPFVWVVQVRRDGLIAFHELGPRALGTEKFNVEVARVGRFPMESFTESGMRRLRDSMKNRLEHAGLFTPEAEAMLNTWKASYYEKPGVRVFYIVPRAWTDHFLPLKLSAPAEITRVIVGRIDIL